MSQGREHIPDVKSRAKVEAFSCAGFSQDWISKYFDIDEQTLRKHYKVELHNARMDKLELVAAHAFRRAMEGDPKMIDLICRTQLKWANAKSKEEIDVAREAAERQSSILEQLALQQTQK